MTVYYHPESDALFADRANGSLEFCDPIPADRLPAYTPIDVAFTQSTTLPDMDFETYSEAGFKWVESNQRWKSVTGQKGGIFAVGAPVYSEHPSTEVLSLAYNLKAGKGPQLWLPGMPPPADLFDHIAKGGLIEAHNSGFEWLIWTNVCMRKMGWPPLPLKQLRCSASKCRAWGVPGALKAAGSFLQLDNVKDDDGTRLLKRFSVPRSPTKKDTRLRIRPEEDPEDGPKLYSYNLQDITAESELSAHVPDLQLSELKLWLTDQRINMRGCQVDVDTVHHFIRIFEEGRDRLNAEMQRITNGEVPDAAKLKVLSEWLYREGIYIPDMQSETIEAKLKELSTNNIGSAEAVRALEIRSIIGSASVKKLYSLRRTVSYDNRLRELFSFCGADRTGRFSGRGAQPQNLPGQGPTLKRCDPDHGCGSWYGLQHSQCPWCGAMDGFSNKVKWSPEAVDFCIDAAVNRGYDELEFIFGNPVEMIIGCLRGLFISAPGKDLICSDYSAIEAVVLAMLAQEQWRIDVFRSHGKIYEMSAAKISGIPFDEIMRHKQETSEDHPLRKTLGKVSELASGYQGGLGAWKNFGADSFMTDDEIKDAIKKWRNESPNIVNFWYGVERCAIAAVQSPGSTHQHNGIAFRAKDDVLYIRLLSGRLLAYHAPRLRDGETPWGKKVLKLSYLSTDQGKVVRVDTYGGKLTENITQATARDILTHALVNLDTAGYSVVLHVHDEIASEVPEGWGSIEEFESIMAVMPPWAHDWPIKAAGGWRGKRFRKG